MFILFLCDSNHASILIIIKTYYIIILVSERRLNHQSGQRTDGRRGGDRSHDRSHDLGSGSRDKERNQKQDVS